MLGIRVALYSYMAKPMKQEVILFHGNCRRDINLSKASNSNQILDYNEFKAAVDTICRYIRCWVGYSSKLTTCRGVLQHAWCCRLGLINLLTHIYLRKRDVKLDSLVTLHLPPHTSHPLKPILFRLNFAYFHRKCILL